MILLISKSTLFFFYKLSFKDCFHISIDKEIIKNDDYTCMKQFFPFMIYLYNVDGKITIQSEMNKKSRGVFLCIKKTVLTSQSIFQLLSVRKWV